MVSSNSVVCGRAYYHQCIRIINDPTGNGYVSQYLVPSSRAAWPGGLMTLIGHLPWGPYRCFSHAQGFRHAGCLLTKEARFVIIYLFNCAPWHPGIRFNRWFVGGGGVVVAAVVVHGGGGGSGGGSGGGVVVLWWQWWWCIRIVDVADIIIILIRLIIIIMILIILIIINNTLYHDSYHSQSDNYYYYYQS